MLILKDYSRVFCRRLIITGIAILAAMSLQVKAEGVKDLKYGAILFQFYQQNYFDTLVEYAYAEEKGGIEGHGNYPELLKGGVSLSYGLDVQAEEIFTRVVEGNVTEEARNRAWFYLGKMQYLRGDVHRAASNLSNIAGRLPEEVDAEYRYLAALANIKLGYSSISDQIIAGIDEDSPYAPYFYFNLGIAYGKQQEISRAAEALNKVIEYSPSNQEFSLLVDRAYMALSFLYAASGELGNSQLQLEQVKSHGAYSNRGLLGASWLAVNKGEFNEALAPLDVLAARSIALPEVQEAILLRPYVYEKLDLDGRAAMGFIEADTKYTEALEWIHSARESLSQSDMMELFVRNLDEVLGESDWFGQAPSVSINRLSPFLVELMSDHSFQSVLKDLRDLYSVRNNLRTWKSREDDFAIILQARSHGIKGNVTTGRLTAASQKAKQAKNKAEVLARRASSLPSESQEKIQWLLDGLNYEIGRSQAMLTGIKSSDGSTGRHYRDEVRSLMALVKEKEEYTTSLIKKLEKVMQKLVTTELDIHEQRLKHYQVEAQLAKVRILDRSLMDLDIPETSMNTEEAPVNTSAVKIEGETRGGSNAI
ncbi:tetratricopeptide repeat protein [Hahella ganghwensis]|uniref:tetratricopeptide repeat protein n=1 Tax=Hahella ganghwensis TaxID=286420 RepID=UPI00036DCFB6|nr:tetratricopeptide repeat protein [Hahella ganghwensis]